MNWGIEVLQTSDPPTMVSNCKDTITTNEIYLRKMIVDDKRIQNKSKKRTIEKRAHLWYNERKYHRRDFYVQKLSSHK